MTKIIQIVIEQSKSFISARFFRKFRQAGCGVGPRETTTFLEYQFFSFIYNIILYYNFFRKKKDHTRAKNQEKFRIYI